MSLRPSEGRPWRAAIVWLAVLGPFFFLSYGFAHWAAAQRPTVPSIVFAWEHRVPFLPWTILPYWLIDVLYALSVFLCATRARLHAHALRLLLVQIACVVCFVLFPLRFSFARPPVDGLWGAMFALLESFDQPFNQAPSLHIALLTVLWPVYLDAVPKRLGPLVHATAILIGLSVLTTWQHHFIDVPTGAWLGAFALWAIREDHASDDWQRSRRRDPQRRRLSNCYALGALACAAGALLAQGTWLWLLWPAAALALVAGVYRYGNGHAYRKSPIGRFPAPVRLLFGPYLLGARINARLWTRHDRGAVEVYDGIHIGSSIRPWVDSDAAHACVIDLAAEVASERAGVHVVSIPMLDLVAPTQAELTRAARAIAQARRDGPVLVACALGYSRSAAAVAAWLVHAGIDATIEAAIERIRRARPRIVLGRQHREALEAFAASCAAGAAATRAMSMPDGVDVPMTPV